jgi:hypothetical protein
MACKFISKIFKRQLRRNIYGQEDGINIKTKEIDCGGVNWITLAQDRLEWPAFVNTATEYGAILDWLNNCVLLYEGVCTMEIAWRSSYGVVVGGTQSRQEEGNERKEEREKPKRSKGKEK